MPLSADDQADLEAKYAELSRRGLLKSNPAAQSWGHEVRRRSLITDPTQGGLVAPAAKVQGGGTNSAPSGQPRPIEAAGTLQNGVSSVQGSPTPRAHYLAKLQQSWQRWMAPRGSSGPLNDVEMADFARKYAGHDWYNAGLAKLRDVPLLQREHVLQTDPQLSKLSLHGKTLLMRAAWRVARTGDKTVDAQLQGRTPADLLAEELTTPGGQPAPTTPAYVRRVGATQAAEQGSRNYQAGLERQHKAALQRLRAADAARQFHPSAKTDAEWNAAWNEVKAAGDANNAAGPGSDWNKAILAPLSLVPGFDESLQGKGVKKEVQRLAAGVVNSVPLMVGAGVAGKALGAEGLIGRGFQAQMGAGLLRSAADRKRLNEDPGGYWTALLGQGALLAAPEAHRLFGHADLGGVKVGEKIADAEGNPFQVIKADDPAQVSLADSKGNVVRVPREKPSAARKAAAARAMQQRAPAAVQAAESNQAARWRGRPRPLPTAAVQAETAPQPAGLEEHLAAVEAAARERLAAKQQARQQGQTRGTINSRDEREFRSMPGFAGRSGREAPRDPLSLVSPSVQPQARVAEVDPRTLAVDAERFQFKSDTDAQGVTGKLKDVKTYDPNLGGILSVWRDPADGKTYVVNGHHRLELAMRTGAPSVAVRYIDAADAPTARYVGALINIAEGQGKAIDAAKVFHARNMTPEQLKAQGISLGGKVASDGMALANLDDSLFRQVANGTMPEGRGVAVGRSGLDHAGQRALFGLIERAQRSGKKLSDADVGQLAHEVSHAPSVQQDTSDSLFGDEFGGAQNLAVEKAQLASYVRQRLGEDKTLFGRLTNEGKAQKLAKGGNQINTGENARLAGEAAAAVERFDSARRLNDQVVDQALNHAAEAIHRGENANGVREELYATIRGRALASDAGAGAESAPGGAGASAGAAGVPPEPHPAAAAAADAQTDAAGGAQLNLGDTVEITERSGLNKEGKQRTLRGVVEAQERADDGTPMYRVRATLPNGKEAIRRIRADGKEVSWQRVDEGGAAAGATKLEAIEQAARDRINARKGEGKQSAGSLGGKAASDKVEDLQDWAIIGAVKIARGAASLAEFTKQMVAEFPQLASHIQDVYDAALAHYHAEIAPRFSLPRVQAPTPQAAPQARPADGSERSLATDSREQKSTGPAAASAEAERQAMPGAAGQARSETLTGGKNALTDAERQTLGLEELPKPERKAMADSLAEGKAAVDSGAIEPGGLARSVVEKPRALSDSETMALTYEKGRLLQAHKDVTAKIADAVNAGDDAQIAALKATQADLEGRFDTVSRALKASGTQAGRALSIRRAQLNEDYSLAALVQRATATKGAPLTDAERARFEGLSAQLEAAQKRIADLEEQAQNGAAGQSVRQMQLDARRSQRRMTRADLDAELLEILKEFGQKTSGRASANPIDLTPAAVTAIRKIAMNRVRAGFVTLDGLVDEVYNRVKDHMEGIEPRDVRDAISGYGRAGAVTKDAAVKQLREMQKQARLLSALEDVGEGQPPAQGRRPGKPSAAVKGLRAQLDEAMAAAGMKNGQGDPLEAVKTRLKSQIDDLTRRINERDFSPAKRGKVTLDAQGQALKDQRDALKTAYDNLKPEDLKAGRNPLPGIKTRLQAQIDDLNRRLQSGDFDFPRRQPTVYDQEAQRLRVERDRLKLQVERQMAAMHKPHWTDYAMSWYRGALLSGVPTLGKLTTAAGTRILSTPIEELIGAGLGRVPGIRRIAAQAPREGGFNAAAEAKALTTLIKKSTAQEMWAKLKTGAHALDVQYDRQGRATPAPNTPGQKFLHAMEFFGRLHGALKTPEQLAEFERALTKRMASAQARGMDVHAPESQIALGLDAYADSQAAILQQDNVAADMISGAVQGAKRRGGATAGAAVKAQVPISKIPFNVVGETLQHLGGGLEAGARVYRAWRAGGIDTMRPEEADAVMRALKRQGIGAGLITIGWLTYKHPLPTLLMHTPGGLTVAIAQAAHRAFDQHQREGAGAKVGGAAYQAYREIAPHTPLYTPAKNMVDAVRSEAGAGRVAGEILKPFVEPQILQNAAKGQIPGQQMLPGALKGDVDAHGQAVPRSPKGFTDALKEGVPGLRRQVPAKGSRSAHEQQPQASASRVGGGGHSGGGSAYDPMAHFMRSLTSGR